MGPCLYLSPVFTLFRITWIYDCGNKQENLEMIWNVLQGIWKEIDLYITALLRWDINEQWLGFHNENSKHRFCIMKRTTKECLNHKAQIILIHPSGHYYFYFKLYFLSVTQIHNFYFSFCNIFHLLYTDKNRICLCS